MVKRLTAVFLLTALLAVTFALGNAAEAGDPEDADLKRILELIAQQRDASHVKLSQNDKLSIPNDLKDGIAYRLERTDTDSKTGKSTTVVDGLARFYPPVTDSHKFKSLHDEEGLAVYNGGSYHLAVDASQYGFSAYVAILDASAPTAYEFEYELPEGFKLSEDGNGGIVILSNQDAVIGAILAPWAYDANGAPVPTEFKLQDGILTQTVTHVDVAYPVVADPNFHLGWRIAQTRLHQREIEWCFESDENEQDCLEGYGIHGMSAIFSSIYHFGSWRRNGPSDAFRHCYWSASMSIGMGRSRANLILTLHEQEPNQPRRERRMDEHNNAIGLALATRVRYYSGVEVQCKDWAFSSDGPLQRRP